LVDLCREDEVVAGKTPGGVRPGREGRPSPLELNAWVVPFRLSQQRDLRDQAERSAEVLKRELPGQAAGVALPARDLASKPGDLRLWERRRPRRVLLAVLVDKLGNGRTVLSEARRGGLRASRNLALRRRLSDL
jgi:hypothetical protein